MDEFSRFSGGLQFLSRKKGIFVNYWVLSHVRLFVCLMATNETDSSRFVNQTHGNKTKLFHHILSITPNRGGGLFAFLQFCDIKKN
jgi:hypothetical protein